MRDGISRKATVIGIYAVSIGIWSWSFQPDNPWLQTFLAGAAIGGGVLARRVRGRR